MRNPPPEQVATLVLSQEHQELEQTELHYRTGGFADLGNAGNELSAPLREEKAVCRVGVPAAFAGPWVVTLGPVWGGLMPHEQGDVAPKTRPVGTEASEADQTTAHKEAEGGQC